MNIGVCGGLCSGKTTTANYFIQQHVYTQASLAAPMKKIVGGFEFSGVEGVISEQVGGLADRYWAAAELEDKERVEHDVVKRLSWIIRETFKIPNQDGKPRNRLQYLGQQARQMIDPEFWIMLLVSHLAEWQAQRPNLKFICDDVRYENEFSYFYRRGWWMLKLKVSPDVQEFRARAQGHPFSPEDLEHPSEVGIRKLLTLPEGDIISANVASVEMLSIIEELYAARLNHDAMASDEDLRNRRPAGTNGGGIGQSG